MDDNASLAQVPTPEQVSAWLVLNIWRPEQVPMWAAHWLVQGYDGPALRQLAGLNGRDTREVGDLLPDALADTGLEPISTKAAATKVAYDDLARLHLEGKATWQWVMGHVDDLVITSGYAEEMYEQPLGELSFLVEELDGGWGRSASAFPELVKDVCRRQLR